MKRLIEVLNQDVTLTLRDLLTAVMIVVLIFQVILYTELMQIRQDNRQTMEHLRGLVCDEAPPPLPPQKHWWNN